MTIDTITADALADMDERTRARFIVREIGYAPVGHRAHRVLAEFRSREAKEAYDRVMARRDAWHASRTDADRAADARAAELIAGCYAGGAR